MILLYLGSSEKGEVEDVNRWSGLEWIGLSNWVEISVANKLYKAVKDT